MTDNARESGRPPPPPNAPAAPAGGLAEGLEPGWAPSVVLVHEVPGVGPHLDWMIAPAGCDLADPDARALMTWRLAAGVEVFGGERFWGVRLPPHRVRYLVFQGDIGGGRGTVRRIWAGLVRTTTVDAAGGGGFVVESSGGAAVRARMDDDDRWYFEPASTPRGGL